MAANEVYAALRGGNSASIATAQVKLTNFAVSLQQVEDERAVSTTVIAHLLGLSNDRPSLAELVQKLSGPESAQLNSIRNQLATATAEFQAAQHRNANLIHHLRCYFRDVLSALMAADRPDRYGPTGSRLASTVAGVHNRG